MKGIIKNARLAQLGYENQKEHLPPKQGVEGSNGLFFQGKKRTTEKKYIIKITKGNVPAGILENPSPSANLISMIKAIIFDLDGPIMSEGADEIFEKHSRRRGFKRDAIKKLVKKYYSGAHRGKYKSVEEFVRKTKPRLRITAEEMSKIFEEMHKTKRVDLRTIRLITKLKKEYKIALLTNFTSDLDRFLRRKFRIHKLFDVVVNSYDIKSKKPSREAYMFTLNKLKVRPAEAIFIDDKRRNVSGAQRVGMKSILFKSYSQCKIELNKILARNLN